MDGRTDRQLTSLVTRMYFAAVDNNSGSLQKCQNVSLLYLMPMLSSLLIDEMTNGWTVGRTTDNEVRGNVFNVHGRTNEKGPKKTHVAFFISTRMHVPFSPMATLKYGSPTKYSLSLGEKIFKKLSKQEEKSSGGRGKSVSPQHFDAADADADDADEAADADDASPTKLVNKLGRIWAGNDKIDDNDDDDAAIDDDEP